MQLTTALVAERVWGREDQPRTDGGEQHKPVRRFKGSSVSSRFHLHCATSTGLYAFNLFDTTLVIMTTPQGSTQQPLGSPAGPAAAPSSQPHTAT